MTATHQSCLPGLHRDAPPIRCDRGAGVPRGCSVGPASSPPPVAVVRLGRLSSRSSPSRSRPTSPASRGRRARLRNRPGRRWLPNTSGGDSRRKACGSPGSAVPGCRRTWSSSSDARPSHVAPPRLDAAAAELLFRGGSPSCRDCSAIPSSPALEDSGCATVMPLGSWIGSNRWSAYPGPDRGDRRAGRRAVVGTPFACRQTRSEAMEIGADAVRSNRLAIAPTGRDCKASLSPRLPGRLGYAGGRGLVPARALGGGGAVERPAAGARSLPRR